MSDFQAGLDPARGLSPERHHDWCTGPWKRTFDIIVSVVILVLLALPMSVIFIRLMLNSGGSPLFIQWREGRDGRLFQIIKFRTMRDGQVTRLGHFLRRTSLDETPQLYNVLKGDMSLVGPRPHIPNMLVAGIPYRRLVPGYERRLVVRPGLTGLAQARGLRGPISDPQLARARFDSDLEYLVRSSLWLDIGILLTTLGCEFLRGNGE